MSASRPPPPVTGCMWISATASDGADGRRDGIANFGALYGVDLNRERSGSIALKITCRAQFDGGSATTPGLRAASMRVYTADADGRVKPADPKSIDEFICLAPCRRPSGPGLPPGCSEFCSESRADFVADCSLRHSFSDEPACESSRPIARRCRRIPAHATREPGVGRFQTGKIPRLRPASLRFRRRDPRFACEVGDGSLRASRGGFNRALRKTAFPCLSGNLQGICALRGRDFGRQMCRKSPWHLAFLRLRPSRISENNREFREPYQGISCKVQGILRPDQGMGFVSEKAALASLSMPSLLPDRPWPAVPAMTAESRHRADG